MKKELNMLEYQQNRKDATRERVEAALRSIKRSKKIITKKEFCQKAGVSLQYLYKYPELNAEVSKYCNTTGHKKKQSVDSKDTIITTLRAENKSLKTKLAEYQKDEKYKAKYDEALIRIKELEKQLKEAYSSNLDDDF